MKSTTGKIEQYRETKGGMGTDSSYGQNGLFALPAKMMGRPNWTEPMCLILSNADSWPDELGPVKWEHASASWSDRVPTWGEMCRLKDMLWYRDEVVMQLHPREEDFVNFDSHTLHLWKPIGISLPTPPPEEDYVNFHSHTLHLWKPIGISIPTPPPETFGPVTGRREPPPRTEMPRPAGRSLIPRRRGPKR